MTSLRVDVKARRIRSVAIKIALLCCLALGLGFAVFVWLLPSEEIALDRNADGIVVLTGGNARITDALELLAAKRGNRLLISGINQVITPAEMTRQVADYNPKLVCCVDFDYTALNTHGNAVETRKWAVKNGFRSLIVVTSAYHMPRALAELEHQLPNVTLIPFPVVSDRLRIEPWWSSGTTTKLVLSEYIKYILVKLRLQFDSVAANDSKRVVSPRARASFLSAV
jgi:uncharacterized SAM-binding protein YcdF (DUF218 family)